MIFFNTRNEDVKLAMEDHSFVVIVIDDGKLEMESCMPMINGIEDGKLEKSRLRISDEDEKMCSMMVNNIRWAFMHFTVSAVCVGAPIGSTSLMYYGFRLAGAISAAINFISMFVNVYCLISIFLGEREEKVSGWIKSGWMRFFLSIRFGILEACYDMNSEDHFLNSLANSDKEVTQ